MNTVNTGGKEQALVEQLQARVDELESKSAQAYQVIGALGDIDDDEVIRALDYFSDTNKYDEDFLPFIPPE